MKLLLTWRVSPCPYYSPPTQSPNRRLSQHI